MDKYLDIVTDWLLRASSQIKPNYFQLPVAGKEEPENRERVYCYELYHLWRSHWHEDFPFTLGGEIDKKGHPFIHGNPKPDFIVHIPGQMTNLLVMEVKPKNADIGDMITDLEKLTFFRRGIQNQNQQPANYHAAYFWVYGLRVDEWYPLRDNLLQRIIENPKIDCYLISSFIHERPEAPAIKVPLL